MPLVDRAPSFNEALRREMGNEERVLNAFWSTKHHSLNFSAVEDGPLTQSARDEGPVRAQAPQTIASVHCAASMRAEVLGPTIGILPIAMAGRASVLSRGKGQSFPHYPL